MKIGKRRFDNKEPIVGHIETIKKFAYFPTIMTNDDLVWLESFIETRKWTPKRLIYGYSSGNLLNCNCTWEILKRERK